VNTLIMSLDAAAETHNRADYTALTTWGVFYNEETENHNIILLNSIKKRVEFPELKDLALNEYVVNGTQMRLSLRKSLREPHFIKN